mgnify:FL=1
MRIERLLMIVLLPTVAMSAHGDEPSQGASFVEEVTIVGSRTDARQITGAAHFIGEEELQRFAYTDVQRVARQIPGVSIQVEDGYGLRPNISIRGVATERSGRITLLEDNVLIAPAPYSAPSAYYFPTMGRMAALEVLKGPSAITQGPYTIGGAFNMISTPIPGDAGGWITAEAGEDATYRVHSTYGATLDSGFGFLVETHQWFSDGFQSVDRSNRDTGLEVQDYTVKLAYAPMDSRHRVELKLQYAEQTSEQSYLGLTDVDFNDDATRRYGLSDLDEIDTKHEQIILRYEFTLNDSTSIGLTAYNNEHERSWFKTEGIDFDGSASAQEFERTSWFNVIQGINSGAGRDGISAADLQAILDGTLNTPAGSIQLRANDREYYSRGVQLALSWEGNLGETQHELELGIRYHEDEEDRLQRNSSYSQQSGSLVLDDLGLLGNAGNRIQQAEALAIHIFDRIEVGRWTLTPGLRFEDIDQSRVRYETRFGRTADPASRSNSNIRDTRSNNTQAWLPGMGVLYEINNSTVLLGGVHKGFTAPSNAPGVNEEEAINYELGIRFDNERFRAELTGFLSDYDNLLGECTSSSGSDCEVGDAFNGDAATVKGFELVVATDLAPEAGLRVPLEVAYTYIDGEFDTNIADTDFFGDVTKGDPVPYIPEHQLQATIGVVANRWAVHVSASYIDEVCARASCGLFEKTEDSLTFDVAGQFKLTERVNLFARVENLTDANDIMGRQPYGARPNKSRTAAIGINIRL